MKGKMSSGRSARLPPTPISAANVVRHVVDVTALTATIGHQHRQQSVSSSFVDYSATSAANTAFDMAAPRHPVTAAMRAHVAGAVAPDGRPAIRPLDLERDLSVTSSQVLESLSERERQIILDVLQRDEQVRRMDATRIMKLRTDLQRLRRLSTLKSCGGSLDRHDSMDMAIAMPLAQRQAFVDGSPLGPGRQHIATADAAQIDDDDAEGGVGDSGGPSSPAANACARCQADLGKIINRGAPCRSCELRVCKRCREFSTHTMEWMCCVCHDQQMELQATSGERMNDFIRGPDSGDGQKKVVRRSWTISSPQQEFHPSTITGSSHHHPPPHQHRPYVTLTSSDEPDDFVSIPILQQQTPPQYLHQHHHHQQPPPPPAPSSHGMDYQNNEYYDRPPPSHPRRVLRQSTLPTNMAPPDVYYSSSGGGGGGGGGGTTTTLHAPSASPKQQLSPQYSPYNTDNEDSLDVSSTDLRAAAAMPTSPRYGIRRQSTLPCRPIEIKPHQASGGYLSTSPGSRGYSRSPEKSPFVRQSTFPANSSADPYAMSRPTIMLHTSPNRSPYNQSPNTSQPDLLMDFQQQQHSQQLQPPVQQQQQQQQRHGLMRQSTLPNPDQHLKLLPTSPPKRQTSPQYGIRRSPEMKRQNTLPNPDAGGGGNIGMSSLSVHQANQPKFMPISPRQKQGFLFPQPGNHPRQFLSQQNVPTVADDPYSSTGSMVTQQQRDQHAKMIKVRSHSNEEYTASRTPYVPQEGRRILPEIPRNRSPSKLVRQGHVLEDANKRTFGDAKSNLPEYATDAMQQQQQQQQQQPGHMQSTHGGNTYTTEPVYNEHSFLEADEDEPYEQPAFKNHYSASDSKVRYDEVPVFSQPATAYVIGPSVRSAESFLPDANAYAQHTAQADARFAHVQQPVAAVEAVVSAPVRPQAPRRRPSKEAIEYADVQQIVQQREAAAIAKEDEHAAHARRKPEAMRSISEDVPARVVVKPVTRRSMSHPEKDSQHMAAKRVEVQKIPSPKPLSDVLERSKVPTVTAHAASLPHQRPYWSVDVRRDTSPTDRESDSFERMQMFPKCPETRNKDSDDDEYCDDDDDDDDVLQPSFGKTTKKPADVEDDQHKSTLNEAELQSAVEAAAVVFKKVVLQRREAANKKQQLDDDEHSSLLLSTSHRRRRPSQLETTAAAADSENSDMDMAAPTKTLPLIDSDDYKLVFISSSESSTSGKDEDDERSMMTDELDAGNQSENSSIASARTEASVDDCDWDYFEPGAAMAANASPDVQRRRMQQQQTHRGTPLDSPVFYRRGLVESPLVKRRTDEAGVKPRESTDTGTDEESTTATMYKLPKLGAVDTDRSSPASSDSYVSHDQWTRNKPPGGHKPKHKHHAKHSTASRHQPQQTSGNTEATSSVVATSSASTVCATDADTNRSALHGTCNCGGRQPQPQYVPVPVPVPIPVPFGAFKDWSASDLLLGNVVQKNSAGISHNLRAIQQQQAADLFQLWSSAAPGLMMLQQQQQQQQLRFMQQQLNHDQPQHNDNADAAAVAADDAHTIVDAHRDEERLHQQLLSSTAQLIQVRSAGGEQENSAQIQHSIDRLQQTIRALQPITGFIGNRDDDGGDVDGGAMHDVHDDGGDRRPSNISRSNNTLSGIGSSCISTESTVDQCTSSPSSSSSSSSPPPPPLPTSACPTMRLLTNNSGPNHNHTADAHHQMLLSNPSVTVQTGGDSADDKTKRPSSSSSPCVSQLSVLLKPNNGAAAMRSSSSTSSTCDATAGTTAATTSTTAAFTHRKAAKPSSSSVVFEIATVADHHQHSAVQPRVDDPTPTPPSSMTPQRVSEPAADATATSLLLAEPNEAATQVLADNADAEDSIDLLHLIADTTDDGASNGGYLQIDTQPGFASGSDSSDTDSAAASDTDAAAIWSVQRSYDVSGVAADDALTAVPHTNYDLLDAADNAYSSAPSDANTTASSDNSDEDDDTVAMSVALRRPRTKKFSRVFVVNHRQRHDAGSGSASAGSSSTSADEDGAETSSDNDTDLDGDCCGIVLNSMKPLDSLDGDGGVVDNVSNHGGDDGKGDCVISADASDIDEGLQATVAVEAACRQQLQPQPGIECEHLTPTTTATVDNGHNDALQSLITVAVAATTDVVHANQSTSLTTLSTTQIRPTSKNNRITAVAATAEAAAESNSQPQSKVWCAAQGDVIFVDTQKTSFASHSPMQQPAATSIITSTTTVEPAPLQSSHSKDDDDDIVGTLRPVAAENQHHDGNDGSNGGADGAHYCVPPRSNDQPQPPPQHYHDEPEHQQHTFGNTSPRVSPAHADDAVAMNDDDAAVVIARTPPMIVIDSGVLKRTSAADADGGVDGDDATVHDRHQQQQQQQQHGNNSNNSSMVVRTCESGDDGGGAIAANATINNTATVSMSTTERCSVQRERSPSADESRPINATTAADDVDAAAAAAKYTSLVMITSSTQQQQQQQPAVAAAAHDPEIALSRLPPVASPRTSVVQQSSGGGGGGSTVSVITSDTTRIVSASARDGDEDDHQQQPQQTSIVVRHTNWQQSNTSGDDDLTTTTTPSAPPRDYVNRQHQYHQHSGPRRRSFGDDDDIVLGRRIADFPLSDDASADGANDSIDSQMAGEASSSSSSSAGLARSDRLQKILAKLTTDTNSSISDNNTVTVVTGADTLSAVVCLEDGLADDDSWVEEISQDEEEFATTTATDSDGESGEEIMMCTPIDREEELRGFNRASIDFTLHTIVEESCEESDAEAVNERSTAAGRHNRLSASELEKYFFYGLGDGRPSTISDTNRDDEEEEEENDSVSESSSMCSEGGGIGGPGGEQQSSLEASGAISSSADLSSSRLEKYFLTGFMGFNANEPHDETDGSGSVGSDSEGRPSPEQRRKRLVRARGTPRSHNSSLDNLLAATAAASSEPMHENNVNDSMEISASSDDEDDECEETVIYMDKTETGAAAAAMIETSAEMSEAAPQMHLPASNLVQSKKQHSRDSGFIGSNDDLLKSDERSPELRVELEEIEEDVAESKESELNPSAHRVEDETAATTNESQPIAPLASSSSLSRKDSFTNWSSDEETNLMMSKMRQFFKTLVVASANAHNLSTAATTSSRSTTPTIRSGSSTPKMLTPLPPRLRSTSTTTAEKPPQLVYFECELKRLMKSVPGINDEQVREIVEYLSSEDTWSDSYDSSDNTSSDLEGGSAGAKKSELQEQISASCQEIIENFDPSVGDEEGDRGDGGTALVYQKLVASFSKMATGQLSHAGAVDDAAAANTSPPIFAKVMSHIGTRLVALMHEVSSGESQHSNASPRVGHSATGASHRHHHHRKLHQKISATTTEDDDDDDSASDSHRAERNEGLGYLHLPRSKSHDLLLGGGRSGAAHHHSNSGVSDHNTEEREASDYERYSWRGSFESALLATGDSRTKLSLLDKEAGGGGSGSGSSTALAAKRRSAGDLLFNANALSREQLDRVRSCGSIGGIGGGEHEMDATQLWTTAAAGGQSTSGQRASSVASVTAASRRRSSIPGHRTDSDADSSEEDRRQFAARSTLPRSLLQQSSAAGSGTTNSLPRLPTSKQQAASGVGVSGPAASTPPVAAASLQKAHSVAHFVPNSVKSARYRPPGFNRPNSSSGGSSSAMAAKKSVSTPGLHQSLFNKRDSRRRVQSMYNEEANAVELGTSPLIGDRNGHHHHQSAASGQAAAGSAAVGSEAVAGSPGRAPSRTSSTDTWPTQGGDEDIDRLVAMHQNRSSLSSLGLRSDSMASVYSGAGDGRYGTVTVKGQVEFGMQYNYKQGALEVHVVQCKDLAAVDTKRNRSDPYVKLYLLPDKTKTGKRKTKVKKHTLNPIFDETLRFHMSLSSLESRSLWLTVWHSDMFGRNDFLGEVTVNLQGRVFDSPQPQWYLLQERSEPFEDMATYRGDIIVGLKFIPPEAAAKHHHSGTTSGSSSGGSLGLRKFGSMKVTSSSSGAASASATGKGSLHVLVKEGKNLQAVKANGSCDAFCKSYLLPDKNRGSKQKTPVVKRSSNPVWNHTFVYDDVSLSELSERALELTIWDHDRLASNEFLGGVRFSLGTGKYYCKSVDWMDSTGREMSLWQSMLNRPNFWVEGCVVMRSSLEGAGRFNA